MPVFAGSWRNLEVAIKVVAFRERDGAKHSATDRVIMEAAVAKSCVHANVVSTHAHPCTRVCVCVCVFVCVSLQWLICVSMCACVLAGKGKTTWQIGIIDADN